VIPFRQKQTCGIIWHPFRAVELFTFERNQSFLYVYIYVYVLLFIKSILVMIFNVKELFIFRVDYRDILSKQLKNNF